ncbi:Wzz/FepE/Etk N-terminal domain-containing protein [Paracoccaceae bacterium Fryx2]|nr:Wzz/FepE/Etk N-terminal domain-containing protein [Paracoccaceae bacterium Fryx2]
MGQIQSLEELLGLILRRRWLIGLVAGIGILLSLIVGKMQPEVYSAAAVIQVQSPIVGETATSGGRSAQILQAVEQRLTTRENLLAVIGRHGLFSDAPGLTQDQRITALRAAVRFQSVAAAGQQPYGAPTSVSALIVTASFADAEQAARVANDFAQGILDLSTAGAAERVRETLRFFIEEDLRLSQDMAALDAEIAAFKAANADALPEADTERRTELAGLETDLRELDQTLVALTGERAAIETRDPLRATDRRQMANLSAQIAVVGQQKAALEGRQATLLAAIARRPEIQRGLGSFDRRLQQLQAQHDLITSRRVEAETNLRLEDQQQAEHFALLERALIPEYPAGGNGRKIAAAGSVASVVMALLLAFVLDLLNPVVRTPAQMERQLDLRPVIAIPEIRQPPTRRGGGAALSDRLKPMQALPRSFVLLGGGVVLLLVMAAAAVAIA